MSIQRAVEFLRRHVEVALATCEGRRPHMRVFQIMKVEGKTLYFATSPEKQVYKQLHENPNIEVMSSNGEAYVKCNGKAHFDVDDDTAQWIYTHNAVLPRLYTSWDKLVYFKMAIETLDHYDLEPTPPVFKHYDIANGTESNGYVGERYSSKA